MTKQTPTVLLPSCGLTRSPHGAGSLLLTGDLHFVVKILLPVQSRLFPVILRKRREEEAWGCKLFRTPDGVSPLRQLPGGAEWWLGLYAREEKHSWRELGPTSGFSVNLKAGRGKRSQPSCVQCSLASISVVNKKWFKKNNNNVLKTAYDKTWKKKNLAI